ncbi:hypothetical protein ABK040_007382 [Willaertia magna]
MNPSSSSAEEKKKRAISRKACEHCKKSHACCEDKRPCKRCTSLGLECFDLPSKKRGRKRKFNGQQPPNTNSTASTTPQEGTLILSKPTNTTSSTTKTTVTKSNGTKRASPPTVKPIQQQQPVSIAPNPHKLYPSTTTLLVPVVLPNQPPITPIHHLPSPPIPTSGIRNSHQTKVPPPSTVVNANGCPFSQFHDLYLNNQVNAHMCPYSNFHMNYIQQQALANSKSYINAAQYAMISNYNNGINTNHPTTRVVTPPTSTVKPAKTKSSPPPNSSSPPLPITATNMQSNNSSVTNVNTNGSIQLNPHTNPLLNNNSGLLETPNIHSEQLKRQKFEEFNLQLAPIISNLYENNIDSNEESDEAPNIISITKIQMLIKMISSSGVKPSSKYEDGKAYIVYKLCFDSNYNQQFWKLLEKFIEHKRNSFVEGIDEELNVNQSEYSDNNKPSRETIEQIENLYLSIEKDIKCPFLILKKETKRKEETITLPSISKLSLPIPQIDVSNKALSKCPINYSKFAHQVEDISKSKLVDDPSTAKTITYHQHLKNSLITNDSSSTYIKSILDLCGIAIILFTFDFDGNILLFNKKAKEVIGLSDEDEEKEIKLENLLHESSENRLQTLQSKIINNSNSLEFSTCHVNYILKHVKTKEPLTILAEITTFFDKKYSMLTFQP